MLTHVQARRRLQSSALLALPLLLLCTVCAADEDDDTLKFYLSRAGLVVVGTIVAEPTGIVTEAGVLNYITDFRVTGVLKGDRDFEGNAMRINIKRFEMTEKDRSPLIKKDSDCILFLKKEPEGTVPQWTTADFWFGVQQPSPWMEKSLKRLSDRATGSH